MRRLYTLIFVISLLISTGFTISFQIQTEEEADNIKVMSYNIHQYYVADEVDTFEKTGDYIFEDLLDVIENENPHIIGLQEAEGARPSSGNVQGIAWLAEKLDMYYYYGNPTQEQTYGNAILSEWPIIASEYFIYPRPEGIERVLVHVVIDSPFGNLDVYNTHFAIGRFPEAQRQAAEFLINEVGDKRAIITGDFNTGYADPTYNILAAEFTYAAIESGLGVNDSSGYTAPTSEPRRKIDYIWLTQGDWIVESGSYGTIGTEATSDHLGIIAELLPV